MTGTESSTPFRHNTHVTSSAAPSDSQVHAPFYALVSKTHRYLNFFPGGSNFLPSQSGQTTSVVRIVKSQFDEANRITSSAKSRAAILITKHNTPLIFCKKMFFVKTKNTDTDPAGKVVS